MKADSGKKKSNRMKEEMQWCNPISHDCFFRRQIVLRIKRQLWKKIFNFNSNDVYETGGFFGIKGKKICSYEFDSGRDSVSSGEYMPNLNLFYRSLKQWEKEGIEYVGILHTHLNHQGTLSGGDYKYLDELMKLNKNLQVFFTAILIPNEKIYFYRVIRKKERIVIKRESLLTYGRR